MTGRAFFLALTVAACAAPASAEVRYTGGTLRDPFKEQVERKAVIDDNSQSEKQLREMQIQGIVASAKDPSAIINGKIFRVGAELAPGHKIKWIDRNGILVVSNDKEILLAQHIKRKPNDPKKA